MCDVTTETIFSAIDRDYSGDVLAFLAEFIDYCNRHTFFGMPMHHSPLECIHYDFDSVLCETSDVLCEKSEGEAVYVELDGVSSESSYGIYATRYYRDAETDEVFPEDWAPYFNVTCPEELASLCGYVGVNFCSDFFEE